MKPTFKFLAQPCCLQQPAEYAIHAAAGTITGCRRANNEDSHYVDPDGRVFLVADGIGGSCAGERASRMAVGLLSQSLSLIGWNEEARDDEVIESIHQAFADANAAIRAAARRDLRYHRMGTTVVAAVLVGPCLFVASLGDSRAYLLRDGRIRQLTVDHSMAQALVQAGTISAEAAPKHPWRNVLWKYLGTEDAAQGPDVLAIELRDGDRFLLASDGLTNVLDEQQLLHILDENTESPAASETLIQAAQDKHAHDDSTCAVLFVEKVAQEEWPESHYALDQEQKTHTSYQLTGMDS